MIYISLQSSKNTEDWERVVEFAVKMPESSGSINCHVMTSKYFILVGICVKVNMEIVYFMFPK